MAKGTFLFSIDLEDIRHRLSDGDKYQERVPLMVERYLRFLEKYSFKTTFFVVGDVARAYPSLIKEITNEGHEVACHSDAHKEVHLQSPQEFERTLGNCLESIHACSVDTVIGYRAPVFSLTATSKWAYPILEKMGITYSSFVLPANNPLNGWKEFGKEIKKIEGVWEIPISITDGLFQIPFAGGVYFRVIPFFIVKSSFKKQEPVVGYFHPYDIDIDQEPFTHPELGNNPFYNFLIYYNRKSTLPRLTKLINGGLEIVRYDKFIDSI